MRRTIKKIDLDNPKEVLQLLDVQMGAYRVEAKLIGFQDIPPLKDSEATLKQSGETFYGYFVDKRLVGAISYKIVGCVLEIYRLMVHPDYFRQGIAGSLLHFIEGVDPGVSTITVATGAKNTPARKLYQRYGYVETACREMKEGISMIFFEKRMLEGPGRS